MTAIDQLLDVMAKLRDPETGCPWDVAQDFATIAPYTIEEAYEVAEAIAEKDWPALEDELGDLLFQVVFYAQMAREDGLFDFESRSEERVLGKSVDLGCRRIINKKNVLTRTVRRVL